MAAPDTTIALDGTYGGGGDIAVGVVFVVIGTLFLALRFVSLNMTGNPKHVEDWIMIPAWFLLIGMCVTVILGTTVGAVGYHETWIIKYAPQKLPALAKCLSVLEFFYGILMPLEKTSLLLLYLRIFGVRRWFRITTYGFLIYVWAWGITISLMAIFQCSPVAYAWDRTLRGSCIDQGLYDRWVSVPNVIHDVGMLILPVPELWKLQATVRKRIALSFVFLIGSIGCVAGFVRLALFFMLTPRGTSHTDNTWVSGTLFAWTVVEPGVIFICACLPTLWPLLTRVSSRIRSIVRPSSTSSIESSEKQSQADRYNRNAKSWTLNAKPSADQIPLRTVEESPSNAEQSQPISKQGPQTQSHVHVTKTASWAIQHTEQG